MTHTTLRLESRQKADDLVRVRGQKLLDFVALARIRHEHLEDVERLVLNVLAVILHSSKQFPLSQYRNTITYTIT